MLFNILIEFNNEHGKIDDLKFEREVEYQIDKDIHRNLI